MEDAHVTETDVLGEPDSAVFGVFDGHGGSEVARFCQTHLMGVLAADADFKARAPPTIGCSVRARPLRAPAPARGPRALARAPRPTDASDTLAWPQMVRCFHELDSMMRTEAAAAELETYKWREPGEDPGAASGTDKEQVRALAVCAAAQTLSADRTLRIPPPRPPGWMWLRGADPRHDRGDDGGG